FFLAACGGGAEAPVSDPAPIDPPALTGDQTEQGDNATQPTLSLEGTLNIASFTDEAYTWAAAFQGEHPNLNINVEVVPMDNAAFQEWLMPQLALGGSIPDVIFLEAEFIRQFVETPFLRDLSHLVPEANALDIFQFTIDAGTYNGEVRAFSHQATPGVMYFRRSMAERYLGTSDPAEVQEFFRDLDSTIEAARLIRDGSDGQSFLVPGVFEFFRGFGANRQQPWIVDNTLTIDPLMMDFIDFARTLNEEGLQAQISAWSGPWFSSMNDDVVDAHGNPIQVFAYLLPTWGLPFIILPNAEDTAGDWGVIESPLPYQWGGTWMAVTRDASNPEAAEEFIRFAVLNDETQERWATGYFTNERLRQIDPSLPDSVYQGPGDLISSRIVAERIAPSFSTGPLVEFLGGQNPYEIFARLAPNVSLALMQGTDAAIGDRWQDAVGAYIEGQLGSVEELLQSFRNDVSIVLPNVDLGN
ncbi:MAG: extracellular solute-binding protein, partial [Defluviitaleaceae bacterium]|nr:extracellular solute-binding protein [Defluviitaleaceae bacterium]